MRPIHTLAFGTALSVTFLLSSGCVSTGLSGMRSLTGLTSPAATITPTAAISGGSESSELPSEQTVALCLATAERLANEGHAREACLLYLKAQKLAPESADYPRCLAPLFAQLNDLPRANQEYAFSVARAPRDADLWNDWGCLLLRQRDYGPAEQKLRQALAVASTHARARSNLAMLCAQTQRNEEAWELFASVVGPAAAHSNLGVILAGQGRDAEARDAFTRALAIDPNLPLPALFLEQLNRIDAAPSDPAAE